MLNLDPQNFFELAFSSNCIKYAAPVLGIAIPSYVKAYCASRVKPTVLPG